VEILRVDGFALPIVDMMIPATVTAIGIKSAIAAKLAT
jgi:hydrogenase/urease accessory protein HupE